MRTRETVLVLLTEKAVDPSSGSTWNVSFTRGLSLTVIPVSRTSVTVPTPRAPLAIRSSALAFLLRNILGYPLVAGVQPTLTERRSYDQQRAGGEQHPAAERRRRPDRLREAALEPIPQDGGSPPLVQDRVAPRRHEKTGEDERRLHRRIVPARPPGDQSDDRPAQPRPRGPRCPMVWESVPRDARQPHGLGSCDE